ncbi:hypothetical protein D9M68_603730 [compost metagenome]
MRRLLPPLRQVFEVQVFILALLEDFHLPIAAQQGQFLLDLGYSRLAEIVGAALPEGLSLGLQCIYAHEVQRNFTTVDFGAHDLPLSLCVGHGRGGSRFANAQRFGDLHGFVKAFNAVLPARFQFAAQGPQLVLQLRPAQGILLEQAGDLRLLARLVAGPCRLDLLFEGEQAVGYQHLQV